MIRRFDVARFLCTALPLSLSTPLLSRTDIVCSVKEGNNPLVFILHRNHKHTPLLKISDARGPQYERSFAGRTAAVPN